MKAITITAYTADSHLHEWYKMGASKAPSWFRGMGRTVRDEGLYDQLSLDVPVGTMKLCPAITEFIKRPVMIRIPFDMAMSCYRGSLSWATPTAEHAKRVVEFSSVQKRGYEIGHCKIDTGWKLVEPEGVPFMFTDAYYHNYEKPWRIVQGVTNFRDQHNAAVNISMPKDQKQINFDAGSVLCYLMPLADRPVKVVSKLVSREEYDRVADRVGAKSVFANQFRKLRSYI